jgi:hypothetical protein
MSAFAPGKSRLCGRHFRTTELSNLVEDLMKYCLLLVMALLALFCSGASGQSLQNALNSSGYSVNVSTDEIPGEIFFQILSTNASIEFQESSQYPIEAFGWYTSSDSGQWVIGGFSTGLPMSANLPLIVGPFGVKLHPNYTGTGFISGIWYSQRSLNTDGIDHAKVFPTKIGGQVIANSYLICWEDLPGGSGDYQDMIVRMNGVSISALQPAPAQLVQWPQSMGGNGHWYAVVPTGMYWNAAVQQAASFVVDGEPGYLATITSQAENDFIMNHLLPGVNNTSIVDQYWLGAQRSSTGWQWSTGEAFQYANWDGGEPTGDGPILGMWGLAITGVNHTGEEREPGHWNDLPANAYTFFAIVEWGTSIGGNVRGGDQPLVSVPVNLIGENGSVIGSVVTDEFGKYLFNGVGTGHYIVSIAPPLGYKASPDTKELELNTVTGTTDFSLIKLAITPQQRSRGWWAHQAYKAFINDPIDYKQLHFAKFAGLIRVHFNQNQVNPVDFYTVPQPGSQRDSLDVLQSLLLMESTGGPEHFQARYAKSELMTMMLNVASSKISQAQVISDDGRTVSQAITYCDYLINGAPTDMETIFESASDSLWKYRRSIAVASAVNAGDKVAAGKIPLYILQIAYKQNMASVVPSTLALAQNYPNPFNPSTIIEFALPKASRVTLDVYNTLGQVVNRLVDDEMSAGHHSFEWNGRDGSGNELASGIYFYRISSEFGAETKKMVMLK